ncbi:MAG: hypothetical protein ACQEQV_10195 [Fibrobacterota bacterium]
MKLGKRLFKLTAAGAAVSALMLTGCTKHPDEAQLNRLEDARGAAKSAEQTKYQKVEERRKLEQQVEAKQGTLDRHKEERDDIEKKMEERNN